MPPTEPCTALAPMDSSVLLAALRQSGAQQCDPVGFYYLETLAQRTYAQQGRVKHLLEAKLAQALRAFQERFEQAQRATDPIALNVEKSPAQASLAQLVQSLAPHGASQEPGVLTQGVGSSGELKTTRYFRNTWSKLSVDKQVAQALEQAPQNAGPMNSHRLVLRSLALMREISPDYLNRFTSYVDTLLCLEQASQGKPVPAKKAVRAKVVKK